LHPQNITRINSAKLSQPEALAVGDVIVCAATHFPRCHQLIFFWPLAPWRSCRLGCCLASGAAAYLCGGGGDHTLLIISLILSLVFQNHIFHLALQPRLKSRPMNIYQGRYIEANIGKYVVGAKFSLQVLQARQSIQT